MNILIRPDTLTKDSEELLWPGTLYGLKRLIELGHAVSFDKSALTDSQKQLLENEKISSSSFGDGESDLTVETDGSLLKATHSSKILHEAEDWIRLTDLLCFPRRTASLQRKTSETEISIDLNLDGIGASDIHTGLPFFNHMLEQVARHGLIDIKLYCDGDLEVDEHHTIEDVAIALGKTITEALGNKVGIQRYAFVLPMDESLCTTALDLSGRPYLAFNGSFKREKVGDLPTEMVEHFFYSLAINLKATLHIEVEGDNDHHKIEACFKSFGRCLRAAVSRSERNLNILPSTKDLL